MNVNIKILLSFVYEDSTQKRRLYHRNNTELHIHLSNIFGSHIFVNYECKF